MLQRHWLQHVQQYEPENTINDEVHGEPTLQTVDACVQTPKVAAYSIHKFEKDPADVHFYTGLETYMEFVLVLHTLWPAAFQLNYVNHSVSNISVPHQLFLVLMKLRRHIKARFLHP